MTLCKAALSYRNQLSYSVIPVGQDKKSLIKWEQFQKRLATEEEIKAWWTKFPEANIGIITGLISGIAVIDIDEPSQAKPVLAELIPDSLVFPICKTPSGGEHWYFSCTDSKLTNNSRLVAGADLRANGGYVVAPPSINGTGKGWRWVEDLKPTKIALPFLPEEYVSFIASSYSDLKYYATLESSILYNGSKVAAPDGYLNKKDAGCQEKNAEPVILNDIFPKTSPALVSSKSVLVSPVSFNQQMFKEGTRDEDLFHVANCLFKGKMPEQEVSQVLEKLALSCSPPFDLKEISAKIESAKKRGFKRDVNLKEEVERWVSVTDGNFSVTNCYKSLLSVTTMTSRDNIRQILHRLKKAAVIEKVGDVDGVYRRVEAESQNIDWYNSEVKSIDIKYPFGIEQYVHTLPKNIIVVAGSPNAGKTSFMLNVIAINMDKFKINYFSSEMGAMELRSRLQKFDFPVTKWRFTAKERAGNFADVIRPEEVNIIDYMELTEDFWRVGGMLKAIYDKLTTGIALVALQKALGATMARGGVGSLEKPRLYLTMERGQIKIEKGKNWAQENVNPNGLVRIFKLIQGCKFMPQTEWYKPDELKKG